ncbi:MAG: transposase, partial [Clostridium sp.]
MSLSKIKTDKSDAKQIYRYALKVDLTLWYGESEMQQDSLQIVRLLSNYTKQSTMMKNKLHG